MGSVLRECITLAFATGMLQGIIHRDVKTSNIMLSRHGILKLGEDATTGKRRKETIEWQPFCLTIPLLFVPAGDFGIR